VNIGVVIPTYNEAENLPSLITTLLALPLDLTLLIVDDNSPDGTGSVADALSAIHPGRANVLPRAEKMGIASAYLQGFRWMINNGVEAVAQMDGDCSHDPAALLCMAKKLESCDVVLGSRYTHGGSVQGNWPFHRRMLSLWGNFYARTILRMPYHDVTTGYRLWRRQVLLGIPWDRIKSSGYIFQVEVLYLAHCLKYNIDEVPIQFAERYKGKSKMSLQIQAEAAWRVWQMLMDFHDIQRTRQPAQIKHMARS
jgi:dolichol-phosphate mannosyltransferase